VAIAWIAWSSIRDRAYVAAPRAEWRGVTTSGFELGGEHGRGLRMVDDCERARRVGVDERHGRNAKVAPPMVYPGRHAVVSG
jgi:hypothetical protein